MLRIFIEAWCECCHRVPKDANREGFTAFYLTSESQLSGLPPGWRWGENDDPSQWVSSQVFCSETCFQRRVEVSQLKSMIAPEMLHLECVAQYCENRVRRLDQTAKILPPGWVSEGPFSSLYYCPDHASVRGTGVTPKKEVPNVDPPDLPAPVRDPFETEI